MPVMQTLYNHLKNETVGDAFRAYSVELVKLREVGKAPTNVVSLARTAVLGYTVPGWGGPGRQGKRMTPAEIEAALKFLDTLPLIQLHQASQAQAQSFIDGKVTPQIEKTNRYQLARFLDWVDEQGWLKREQAATPDKATEARSEVYRHSFNIAHSQGKPSLKHLTLTQRTRRPDFGLKTDEMNPRLKAEFEALAQFGAQHLIHRPATITTNLSFLRRMLGWLHQYRQIPLDELALTSLIPYTPLQVSLKEIQAECADEEEEALQKLLLRRERCKELAEEQARKAEQLWEDYCAFYSNAPATLAATLQALISVAKYLYRYDTENTASKSGYSDVPIMRRLRQKLIAVNKLRRSKPKEIPFKKRSISWGAVLDVLKQQQAKYEEQFYYSVREMEGKVQKQKQIRRATAIACDLQLLLVLCFFTVIPPVRNRTICELELGRTLIRGAIEDGGLIPIEKMARPELAQWHLRLEPEDYKTGAAYGAYYASIEDVELANGQTFYGLLQTWLETYRPLFKPQHNQVFIKVRTTMGATPGDPITYRNLTSWVKYLFYKHTGVPVVPQSLRKMYVTHLKNCGASEAELDAAAKAMHHSRAMQSAEYDEQDLRDKIAPISAFNQKLFKQAFQSSEKQALPLTRDGQISLGDLSDGQIKELLQGFRKEQRRRSQSKTS